MSPPERGGHTSYVSLDLLFKSMVPLGAYLFVLGFLCILVQFLHPAPLC
jgi:hypothetical protein